MNKDEKLLNLLLAIEDDERSDIYLCNRVVHIIEKNNKISIDCDNRDKVIAEEYPEFKEWIEEVGGQLCSEEYTPKKFIWGSPWPITPYSMERQEILLNKIDELQNKLKDKL